jgi:hypothetical protein
MNRNYRHIKHKTFALQSGTLVELYQHEKLNFFDVWIDRKIILEGVPGSIRKGYVGKWAMKIASRFISTGTVPDELRDYFASNASPKNPVRAMFPSGYPKTPAT